MIISAYFGSFWVLKSNGIHPKIITNNILCSVGIMRIDEEGKAENVEMDTKLKKAMDLV